MGSLLQKQMLHDYQNFSIDFILNHKFAALFLDCGLGKTIITLTAIKELLDKCEIHRCLVVGPLRIARDVWADEVRKWDHLSDLTIAVAVGTAPERKAAVLSDAQVVTIGRDNLDWLVNKSGIRLDEVGFDMIVLDELSSFKAYNSNRSKAIYKVQPRMRRMVGLTGTPSSNGLMDLFAEFKVLDGGVRLGRYITHFRETYFRPGWGNGTIVYNYIPLPDAEERIYQKISDITVSMRAIDHLDMPELLSLTVPVYMDSSEYAQYRTMQHDLILELDGHEIDAKSAVGLSGKLAQMANGAIYTEDGGTVWIHDRKLDALEDLIEAAQGRPVMVAYWYKHDKTRIKQRFQQAREIVSSKDISDWNERKIQVALIHPASAGHGLNLQAGGNVLVWFGLTWSLELYQQCNARLWRQGQREQTVTIYHIITSGTIDERVMEALANKNATQTALIEAVRAEIERSG